jgi:hypothetical protein
MRVNLIFAIAIIFIRGFPIYADEIEGVLVPNKGFDSEIPFASMYLSKLNPPVVKITVARPTLLLFPFQVSNCWGNNTALAIADANIVKDSKGNTTNFSQVILNVKGEVITDGSIPDQTAINCKSVDNDAYPIGISFVENNSYSIVKFIRMQQNNVISLDQFGFEKGISNNQKPQNNKKIQFNESIKKDNIPEIIKIEKKIHEKKSIKDSLEAMGIFAGINDKKDKEILVKNQNEKTLDNKNVASDKDDNIKALLHTAGIIAGMP